MKKSKVSMILAAGMLTVLFGGCGEPLYNLTENEKNIIVDYSAHIVSKFNSYQQDGLTWVDYEAEKEKQAILEAALAAAEEEAESPGEAQEADLPDGHGGTSNNQGSSSLQTATLNELFGIQGISVEYKDAYIADNYIQDTYYATYPDEGKKYLIVQIDLINTAGVDVEVDNLVLASSFRAVIDKEVKVLSEITILMEDFAQFQDIVPADTVKETVLLFQVPDTLTQFDDLELYVTMGQEDYQIIL